MTSFARLRFRNLPSKNRKPPTAPFLSRAYPRAMKKISASNLLIAFAALSCGKLFADDQTQTSPDTRFGLFNLLDHRSGYGEGVYPEPFLVDDSDLERGELRLDGWRTASGADHSDFLKGEIEYGFGEMTLEIEAPFERDVEHGVVTEGYDNIDVGARYPFYQFVSRSGFVDTTFGAAVEVGIPTTSPVSKNTELVPKIFNDTKIGNFTAQSIFGYSMLYGPHGDGEEGGIDNFEYGFTFGYTIPRKTLPLPGILELIPVLELNGAVQVNKAGAGHDNLIGDVGLRANCKTIGRIQPRPGVVFIFPVDSGARADTHWGIMTSLVFEF